MRVYTLHKCCLARSYGEVVLYLAICAFGVESGGKGRRRSKRSIVLTSHAYADNGDWRRRHGRQLSGLLVKRDLNIALGIAPGC